MTTRLEQSLLEQKQQTQQEVPQIPGILGIPLGGQRLVEVSGRNGYVYVRLRNIQNEVIQAFNNQVAAAYNLPVLVERQGNRYVVIGVDTQRYENNWGSFAPFLPRHGNTHSFDIESGGGGDIVWVYPRQFMPALVFPSGSAGGPNVVVAPYTLKNDNGTWKYVGNTGTQNITSYRPSSPTGAIMGLVYLNTSDGNPYFFINSGTVFSNAITGTSQIYPYIPTVTDPSTQIPLAAIRLITGTVTLSWDSIYDVRQFLHNTPTGTGGGGSITVQDEGVSQGAASTFNFVGDNVQATVSGGTARIFVTGSAGGGGINTGTLDARYLKLDASNDPVTGDLQVNARLVAVGRAGQISGNLLVAQQYDHQYLAGNIEHYLTGSVTAEDSTFLIRRTVQGNSYAFFPFAALDLWDNFSSGSIYGGVLSARTNNTQRLLLNPHATGTLPNYVLDTDTTRPTGTVHTSFRVAGSEKAYVDVSGTFHSNGSPLTKEAPITTGTYARKNAGWMELSYGGAALGSDFNITASSGVYEDTGLSIVLPSAGTYMLEGVVRAVFGENVVGGYMQAKFYNSTDAADVPGSATLLCYFNVGAGTNMQTTVPMMPPAYTVNGSKTIKLYAARTLAGTPSASQVASNSAGETSMRYRKVG